MILLPAMDLYEKRVVRLFRGDYEQMTVFSETPGELVKQMEEAGASWLHLVDLEGARKGTCPHADLVRELCSSTGLKIEIGGGIRSMEAVRSYLEMGADRVILGTRAVEDPDFLREALALYGERIAIGVDAKNRRLAVRGWQEVLDLDLLDFIQEVRDLGGRYFIVTDIERDGAMQGTNLDLYRELSSVEGIEVIASGGVSSYEDIRGLGDLGLYGAILGKAFYTGDIDLKTALAIAGQKR